jgi:small-conductance mechanosensitive channel
VVGEDINGKIKDITLFHLIVDCGEKGVVTIPNNIVIQKSIRILPRNTPVDQQSF